MDTIKGPSNRKRPRKVCLLKGVQCQIWRIHHVRCTRLLKTNASIMGLNFFFQKRRKRSPEIRMTDIAPVARQRHGQIKSLNCTRKEVVPRSRRSWKHNIQFCMLRKMRGLFWFFRSRRGTKANCQALPSPSKPPDTLTGGVSTSHPAFPSPSKPPDTLTGGVSTSHPAFPSPSKPPDTLTGGVSTSRLAFPCPSKPPDTLTDGVSTSCPAFPCPSKPPDTLTDGVSTSRPAFPSPIKPPDTLTDGVSTSCPAFPSPSVPTYTLTGGVSTSRLSTSETFHRREFWTNAGVPGRSEERPIKGSSRQTLDKKLGPLEQCAMLAPNLLTSKDTDTVIITKKTERIVSAPSQDEITSYTLELLCRFYRKYGSFRPLKKKEFLVHLKEKFNTVHRYASLLVLMEKCESAIVESAMPAIRVVYKKHTLMQDDLVTLQDENWLNDQVMNMYGELIMESAQHTVHFFNSFFHRQLMTKGYEGVRRWTKKVDLFSKTLILIPIHLEVHWCLVTAEPRNKRIQLFDSRGLVFIEAAENILKYVMSEARERNRTSFQTGWEVSVNEEIPQQTNENDCGVFVLEYCRRLGLGKPLHFLQEDIPKVRKRIYKELCQCKLKL